MNNRLIDCMEKIGDRPSSYFKNKDLSEEAIAKIIGLFEACDSWTEFYQAL